MTRPFFSVVIPTRNRPDFAKETIQSVLNQTFTDFEIVLSDNSDADNNQTFECVAQFDDDRIRYFRVHDLSMADNWEYARKQATGEYITLMGDKRVYRNWSLEYIKRIVIQEKVRVVSWVVDMIDDIDTDSLFFKQPRRKIENTHYRYLSSTLIKQFLHQHFSNTLYLLPRGLNSVVHYSIIEDIIQAGAKGMCQPVTPDYTMAFLQLAVTNEIVHIPTPLTLSRISVGTGHAFNKKQNMQQRQNFIESSGGEERFYDQVLIKTLSTQNLLYNDYFNIKQQVGGHLAEVDLPVDTYFVRVYEDIAKSMVYGADFSGEFAAWNAKLAEQPATIQQAVRQKVRPIAWRYHAITLGNRISLVPMQRLYRRLRKGYHSPIFKTIFEALDWEAAQNPNT